jgi:MiaB/RimO family radical SAM methylthiotransferase
MMKKIFIQIVGCCRRRSLDATRLAEYFRLNKCEVLEKPDYADYILLVTCAYKKSKEDECFTEIRKFKKNKGELIILGCLPGIASERLNKEFNGKCLVTEKFDEIDRFFPEFKIKFAKVSDGNKEFPFAEKNICFLRISKGCIANCSYCAIPKATGKLVSKPLKDCLKEYVKLVDAGYSEINFCAENVGAYGTDIKSSFEELLKELSKISNNIKWAIHELHPCWVLKYKKEILDHIKQKRIVNLGCTIQSGSPKILKLMNRFVDLEELKLTLNSFKKINPKLNLYTHVLIGFPGETEQDFEKTLQFIKKINFDLVIFYVYTDRDGTPAAKMNGKVKESVKAQRLKKCLGFCKKNKIKAISDEVDFLK